MASDSGSTSHASLALAVVAASEAPMLLLDGGLAVVAASLSSCAAFRLTPAAIVGMSVFDLNENGWNEPRLRSLLNATLSVFASVERYELNLTLPGIGARRLLLKAQKLDYGAPDEERLLLSVVDVTQADAAARVTEALIRDKTMLIKEVQHRVANSLQIIASILMQSARKVQSDEARGHLADAHQRVMSIASLQRHLAEAGGCETELEPYLSQLCDSIGASMIYDRRQLSIEARIDKQLVAEDVSISLGLVVTELVINALKHAFPDKRIGRVLVDYVAQEAGWTLSVSDNGIGMSTATGAVKPGLGTNIVQALARQPHADIAIAALLPGTKVSLIHSRSSEQDAVDDGRDGLAV